jgi:hypothetical protein
MKPNDAVEEVGEDDVGDEVASLVLASRPLNNTTPPGVV